MLVTEITSQYEKKLSSIQVGFSDTVQGYESKIAEQCSIIEQLQDQLKLSKHEVAELKFELSQYEGKFSEVKRQLEEEIAL